MVPDFSLTVDWELLLSLLIVAEFRETSFLVETADLVPDERLSTAEPLFTRAL